MRLPFFIILRHCILSFIFIYWFINFHFLLPLSYFLSINVSRVSKVQLKTSDKGICNKRDKLAIFCKLNFGRIREQKIESHGEWACYVSVFLESFHIFVWFRIYFWIIHLSWYFNVSKPTSHFKIDSLVILRLCGYRLYIYFLTLTEGFVKRRSLMLLSLDCRDVLSRRKDKFEQM